MRVGDKVQKLPGGSWGDTQVDTISTITYVTSDGGHDGEGVWYPEPGNEFFEEWPWKFVGGNDPVSPKHYSAGMPEGVEVIDIIRAQGWDDNFYLANATKYLLRCEHKGSKVEDLKKLLVYVGWELERLEAK